MRKFLMAILILALAPACSSNDITGEYTCEMPDGTFGSVLKFKKGGKLFLDLVKQEWVERSPNLGDKLNVAGTYEIIDDKIVIKYFDGYQTHTLSKVGDKLTSTTNTFRLCTCQTK